MSSSDSHYSEKQSALDAATAPEASSQPPRPDISLREMERKGLSNAPEVQRMLDEEAYEKELFGRIMSGAREEKTPLSELHASTTRLAVPHKTGTEDADVLPAEADISQDDEWNSGLDGSGNPRWITLSVPEREEESGVLTPESVLPPQVEPPSKSPYQKDDKSKKKSAGQRRSSQEQTPEPSRTGGMRPRSRRPRPVRNFIRMLLAVAILGMLYHILSQRGWVPQLF